MWPLQLTTFLKSRREAQHTSVLNHFTLSAKGKSMYSRADKHIHDQQEVNKQLSHQLEYHRDDAFP